MKPRPHKPSPAELCAQCALELLLTLAVLAILFGVLGAARSCCAAEPLPKELVGRVVRVTDGDTYFLEELDGSVVHKIREHEVDAPETKQKAGPEARAFASRELLDQVVRVEVKGQSYDRFVGRTFLNDTNRRYAESLVAAGFAWCDPRYCRTPKLFELEAEARAAKRGLWKQKRPQAPWEFRKPPKRRAA